MAYQVLYRQWRPAFFREVVGQEAVVRTLRRQVETNRVAHAYLFSGTRGTGKTTLAQIFSRAINCLAPDEGEPCGECANCVSIASGNGMDVEEIDAASNNGVDEIRSLRDRIKYPPQNAKYRVYIIDEVHMLSSGAFNALLKTLEEPPPHAVMILATTEPQRIPATILSRCQRFDFKRISVREIAERLKEIAEGTNVPADEDALLAIARFAEGGMRDAISLFDMCTSIGGRVTIDVVDEAVGSAGSGFLNQCVEALAASDSAAILRLIGEAAADGRDIAVLSRELCANLRELLICMETGDAAPDILEISPALAETYRERAKRMGAERCLRAMELFARAETNMRWASQPRTIFELAAVRACRPEDQTDADSLRQRIEALEMALEKGVSVKASPERIRETPAPAVAPQKKEAPAPKKETGAVWKAASQWLIKNQKMPVFTALKKARLEELTDDSAIVAYDPEFAIFHQMTSSDENVKTVEAALSEAAGRPIKVRVILAGQTSPVKTAPPPSPSSANRADSSYVPENDPEAPPFDAPFDLPPEPPPSREAKWVEEAYEVFGRENVVVTGKEE